VSAFQTLPAGTIIQGQLVDLVWQGQTAPTRVGSGKERIENMPIRRIPSGWNITQVIPVATGLDQNGRAIGIKELEALLIGVGPDGTISLGPRDARFDLTRQVPIQMSRFELAYNAAQLARASYETGPVPPGDIETMWPGVRVTAAEGTTFRASPDTDWLEIETSSQGDGAIIELPKYRMLRDQLRVVHFTFRVPLQDNNADDVELRLGLWKGKAGELGEFIGFRRTGTGDFVWHVATAGRPARSRSANFGAATAGWRVRINSFANEGGYRGLAATTSVNNGVYFPYVEDNISDIVSRGERRWPVFQVRSASGKPVKVRLELMAAIRSS
jgi:hypothetical protein